MAIVGASHRQFRLSPLVHFFLDSGNGQRRKGGEKKQGGNESEKTKRRRRGGKSERKSEGAGKPHKSDNLWQKGVLEPLSQQKLRKEKICLEGKMHRNYSLRTPRSIWLPSLIAKIAPT